jgi:3-oxoacid CoA-transferase subunit B
VHRIITDLGVFDVTEQGFALVERAPEVSLDVVRERTGAEVIAA